MHRVVVLAVPGAVPFELALPGRLFGAAFALDGSERYLDGTPLYTVKTCSIDGRPIRTSADYSIAVDHDSSLLQHADTVVIPPSRDPDLWSEDRGPSPEFVAALASIPPGVRIMALCTGAFAVAAAGLLDGRTVTTHWREAAHLQRLFPALRVAADVLFVDDGDILTSAGVLAGVDLCLHVIRQDHGSHIANEVARACVVAPWREGHQHQLTDRLIPTGTGMSTAPARAWALTQLDHSISMGAWAARSGMSTRSFSRRFRQECGTSPAHWLTTQRLDVARHLLESTELTITEIARRAGFGTATTLRNNLMATTGQSPHAYRRAVLDKQRPA